MLSDKTKADFDNMIQNDVTCQYDGYTFHSSLGYGQMIKTYPYGCQSDKTLSWPLFLREQKSGRKLITSFLGYALVRPFLYFDPQTLLRPTEVEVRESKQSDRSIEKVEDIKRSTEKVVTLTLRVVKLRIPENAENWKNGNFL